MKRRTTSSDQAPDLFGLNPRQGDLFADEPPRNNGVGVANPDEIRARLYKMLADARAAESSPPWNERTTRLYQAIFPQMANWLPYAEAEQLRLEFHTELERLGVASRDNASAGMSP
ncbi:MAG: hypothetical protein ACREDT_16420 [Methylocella sp.]